MMVKDRTRGFEFFADPQRPGDKEMLLEVLNKLQGVKTIPSLQNEQDVMV